MAEVIKKVKKFFVSEPAKVIPPAPSFKSGPALVPNRIGQHTHKTILRKRVK